MTVLGEDFASFVLCVSPPPTFSSLLFAILQFSPRKLEIELSGKVRAAKSSNGSKEGGNNWSVDGTGGGKEEGREKR